MQRAASVTLVLALLALSAMPFASTACTTEEGATPTCEPDLGSDGKNQHKSDGCNPYAICTNDQGDEVEPIECCKGFVDPEEREDCLNGYGVVVTGAGGGGATSSTSGAGGTGGAGGGGGN
jgi:hypothetical protein